MLNKKKQKNDFPFPSYDKNRKSRKIKDQKLLRKNGEAQDCFMRRHKFTKSKI